uniref:Matrix metallopeptidase 30 n=1 Tax=Myripristis murdjan TaxID=586833 RepID=A0A667XMB2_9TELE
MTGALAAKTLISLVLVALCGAAPAAGPSQDELSKAQAYLSRFFSNVGVSAPNSVWRSSLDSFDDTLRKMQEFFGLAVTGTLDSNTLEVMDQPRCGFTDVARFAHFDGRPRWDKTLITYRITEYTPDLSRSEVDATIAQAFKLYSDVTPLNFKQINTGTADIMIFFKEKGESYHGDFSPFDGPGKVLAHAFSPGEGRGGDTHFDEDEQWSLNARGVNLLLVAAHELGHALGLAHSKDRTALMFPNYQYVNTQGYKLPEDDKQGVQAIYGSRTVPTQAPAKPDPKPQPAPNPPELESTPEPLPDRCYRHLRFDAATSIEDNLCFFKNGYFWKKSGDWDGITTRKIQSVWPGINHVDAAYEFKSDNIVFLFEGDHYWGVRGNTVLPGYPKPLSDLGFPPSVTKVDAAVYVTFTGRTLLFERHRYWSFNNRRGRMDAGYPKLIYRDFRGIGYKVDSAFENNGYLYFSAGYRQTEYHYPRRRVLRTLLNYSWLDCN